MTESKTKSEKVQAGLADYVEVSERITKFFEKYPEGSLQAEYEWKDFEQPVDTDSGYQTMVIVKARAYRTPDDKRPGVGLASEPFPGKTPYTKDSELMNGETSAWGRALAALGIEVHRGIASGNEVRARGGGATEPATSSQIDYLLGKGKRPGLFSKAQLGVGEQAALVQFVCGQEELTKAGAGKLIGALKPDPEKGAMELLQWLAEAVANGDSNALKARALITDDVPADTRDLSDAEQQTLEGTPLEAET